MATFCLQSGHVVYCAAARPNVHSVPSPDLAAYWSNPLQRVKLADRGAALQLVKDSALDPVGLLAFALGLRR